jgi:hypothetical protein
MLPASAGSSTVISVTMLRGLPQFTSSTNSTPPPPSSCGCTLRTPMTAAPLNRVPAMKSCGLPNCGGGRAVASHAEICTTDLALITPVQLKFFQPVDCFGHHTRMVLDIGYLPFSITGAIAPKEPERAVLRRAGHDESFRQQPWNFMCSRSYGEGEWQFCDWQFEIWRSRSPPIPRDHRP